MSLRFFLRLRLCVVRLEELDAVWWKELEVPGSEHGSPEKLHVPAFHLEEVASRLVHCGGRGSDAHFSERISRAKRRRHLEPLFGKLEREGIG